MSRLTAVPLRYPTLCHECSLCGYDVLATWGVGMMDGSTFLTTVCYCDLHVPPDLAVFAYVPGDDDVSDG